MHGLEHALGKCPEKGEVRSADLCGGNGSGDEVFAHDGQAEDVGVHGF